ncbi:hypothetical protein Rs2_03753 [Raphanus sativus]|nr:hypothetical protein Rs2_03753 [Raphanus sativus]
MTEWQNTRTAIQIGPSILDGELAGRVMSVSTWLKNYEIDALMYIFRERTILQRWKVDRVAFMTCVFSDLIASDYIHFCKGIKQYNMNPLLLEYVKGELPSHGRTRKLWNVDVDRILNHTKSRALSDYIHIPVDLRSKMVKKYARKKNQNTPSEAPETHDIVAASSLAQPECDKPLEAAPWPRDPLTPFENIRIRGHPIENLSKTSCVTKIERFDEQFFFNSRTFYPGKIYRFTVPDGTILHCKLPQPTITSLTSAENMRFMPSSEFLCPSPQPATKRRRGSSSSGPAQGQREDDTIHDIRVDHTPDPSIEYLLPAYTGQYDSGAPPLDGTPQQQFAWTADTLVKLSTMMQTVWGALEKIRCPPPPSCCRAPQTSEPADMTEDIPDITRHRDVDDAVDELSDGAADAERSSRLHRSRRAPGQSRSASPDDHN